MDHKNRQHSLGWGNPFNGAIDEVKLYDIVRTPEEIQALAAQGTLVIVLPRGG